VNAREAGKLIGLMALYDNRKQATQVDIVAWLKVIGDLAYSDCEAAVIGHYRESTDRIMPANIRERVAAIRQARLDAAGPVEIPEHLADRPAEAIAWKQRALDAIADGVEPQKAIGGAR
jgi:hypothetical protein